MFTGIVEELGEVVEVRDLGDASVLSVRLPAALVQEARRGDSYAVNGVCLTVTEWTVDGEHAVLRFDVMQESLDRSSLGALTPGSAVNIERPMQLDGRFGGHLVQGHVDGVGTVLARTPAEHWEVVSISLPDSVARYVVDKGSITVDGISLTVVEVAPPTEPNGDESFTVSLIPETLARTTLGRAAPGSPVNLEVDVIGKYVERLLGARA
jgi:riboflavin synthase